MKIIYEKTLLHFAESLYSVLHQVDPITPIRTACHNILLTNMRDGSRISSPGEFDEMINQCLRIFWRSLPEGNALLDLFILRLVDGDWVVLTFAKQLQ